MNFKEIPQSEWPFNPPGLSRVYKSKHFFVQLYRPECDVPARISVNRVKRRGSRWRDGITWDELQAIKSAIGFGGYTAIEIYPPDRHVVNVANMRHLWLLSEPLPYMWRNQ